MLDLVLVGKTNDSYFVLVVVVALANRRPLVWSSNTGDRQAAGTSPRGTHGADAGTPQADQAQALDASGLGPPRLHTKTLNRTSSNTIEVRVQWLYPIDRLGQSQLQEIALARWDAQAAKRRLLRPTQEPCQADGTFAKSTLLLTVTHLLPTQRNPLIHANLLPYDHEFMNRILTQAASAQSQVVWRA